MVLTGRIIAVMQPRSGVSQRTGNSWMTQEYVLEVPGTYPKRCVFNIFGEERIKQFNIQVGQDLNVEFDIDAREYNGRWYNDVRAYNVTPAQPVAAAPAGVAEAAPFPPQQNVSAAPFPPQQNAAAAPFPPAQESAAEGSSDDLPF